MDRDRRDAAVEATRAQVTRGDSSFGVTSPSDLIATELTRADAARGRLLLIGSLGVAILLAFAVFLALMVRDDIAAETARLAAVGARRRDRLLFLGLEATIPAVIGAAIGWLGGALVVAALAAWAGAEPLAIVGGALLAPSAIAAGSAVLLVAVASNAVASAPGLPRTGVQRTAGIVAVTVVVLLGWGLATTGSLGAERLAGSLADPVVILLPPMLAFLLALAFLAVLPPVLRALSRRLRTAPLPLRLSLLSVAREPGRPAATLTLLAFSLGAIVFAMGWSASLRQGIDDAAAYRSGGDLRVIELGTGLSISRSVVPTDRYAALGDGVTAVPVYRDHTDSQPDGPVEILGIDPTALAASPGWRSDFSATPVAELAERLALPAPEGGWRPTGHRLPADAAELALMFRYTGDPLKLAAVVATDDGDSTVVQMGTLRDGMTEARAPLLPGARGGTLTALIFSHNRFIIGGQHQHERNDATIVFTGLDGLTGSDPIALEIFTVSTVIVRAPQPTDGIALPVIVSPDLAATAAADGSLDLHVGAEGRIPLRVVGVATGAPTVVAARPRFMIVPLDPFLVALGSATPGAGQPNEMWLRVDDPERLAGVRTALGDAPFRFADVSARSDFVAERAGDPLSQGIVWALVLAAIAGLVLAVGGLILGTVTDLRDERGELADLEAQGVTPSTLALARPRSDGWLAGGGALAGVVVGVVLTVFVTAALSLTAEGQLPIPPLVVVIPVVPIIVVVAVVLTLVAVIAAWLTRRTFGRAHARGTTWRSGDRQAGRRLAYGDGAPRWLTPSAPPG